MKFLAILKDSIREAIDTKVFYAMLGLSCLVFLIVASISYKPVPVESDVKEVTDAFNFVNLRREFREKGLRLTWRVENFEQTNAPAEPWHGDYRFTIFLELPGKEDFKALKETAWFRQGMASNLETALRAKLFYLDNLRVTQVDSGNPDKLRFDVTTHGTRIKSLKEWPHEPTIFFALPLRFWHEPVGGFIFFIESVIVNNIGAGIALLISTIITAFFIPNMLRKGTLDLLLVKPIHRTRLLVYKYIGGLSFMLFNCAFIVLGIWLILGLRSGVWGTGFLISIVVLTFQFAFYYAISTLFGVLTRSSIVAILVTCVVWLVVFLVGHIYSAIDQTRKLPEIFGGDEQAQKEHPRPLPDWAYKTADVVHFLTPRIRDLDVLSAKMVVDDALPTDSPDRKLSDKLYSSFKWTEAVTATAVYMVLCLGIACWWFATKDY
jgi:ABC-type transport system involved in multi-copper enzyme maturation permease subunit